MFVSWAERRLPQDSLGLTSMLRRKTSKMYLLSRCFVLPGNQLAVDHLVVNHIVLASSHQLNALITLSPPRFSTKYCPGPSSASALPLLQLTGGSQPHRIFSPHRSHCRSRYRESHPVHIAWFSLDLDLPDMNSLERKPIAFCLHIYNSKH